MFRVSLHSSLLKYFQKFCIGRIGNFLSSSFFENMAYTYTPQHNTKEPATTTTRDDAMTTEQQQPSVLFHALAVSKTTSIEECVSKNYGSWRALLNAMKEMQRNEDLEIFESERGTKSKLVGVFSPVGHETVERAVADVCGRIREVCELQRDRGEFDGRFWDEEWWTDNENEQKTIRTPMHPLHLRLFRGNNQKAVMIEIPIDGKCETEREEKEDPFKVSGRVVNTPPSART